VAVLDTRDRAEVALNRASRAQAVDVANRPEAFASAQMCVHRDPVGAGVDADRLQPEAVDARTTARCHEQAIAAELAPGVELQTVVLALASRRGGVHPQDKLDSVAA